MEVPEVFHKFIGIIYTAVLLENQVSVNYYAQSEKEDSLRTKSNQRLVLLLFYRKDMGIKRQNIPGPMHWTKMS